jgi:hypothetical protein
LTTATIEGVDKEAGHGDLLGLLSLAPVATTPGAALLSAGGAHRFAAKGMPDLTFWMPSTILLAGLEIPDVITQSLDAVRKSLCKQGAGFMTSRRKLPITRVASAVAAPGAGVFTS